MCGILGGYWPGQRAPRALLERGLARLAHRGPDGAKLWVADDHALGCARLAIYGLGAGGDQPFFDHERCTALVANATLHEPPSGADANERALALRIGTSDCAAILPLYRRLGYEFLREVHGPAAIAIFDQREETLHLAADSNLEKPLFFALDGSGIAFASEVAALLQIIGRRTLDVAVAAEFLAAGFLPGRHTLATGVLRVMPGEVVSFRRGVLTRRIVARPPRLAEIATSAHPASPSAVTSALEAAVARRLRTTRKVGLLLSGGLDSASIACALQSLGLRGIPAFTLRSEDPLKDESDLAQLTAAATGLEHHLIAAPKDPGARLDALISTSGEALADPSWIALDATIEAAGQEGVVVVLAGDGGDEWLAGYRRHRVLATDVPAWSAQLLRRVSCLVPGRLGDGLAGLGAPPLARAADLIAHAPLRHLRRCGLVQADRKALTACLEEQGASTDDPNLRWAAECDARVYLPFNLNPKADRAAMRHGLETWAPFQDPEFIQVARRVPAAALHAGGQTKSVLRAALRGRLPDEVVLAKKRGFAVPYDRWLTTGDLADLADSAMGAERDFLQQFIPAGPQRVLDRVRRGDRRAASLAFAMTVLARWKQLFA